MTATPPDPEAAGDETTAAAGASDDEADDPGDWTDDDAFVSAPLVEVDAAT